VTRRCALLIALIGVASLLLAASAQDSSSKPATADRVVFAVFDSSSISGSEPGIFVDPIVMVSGSEYVPPPAIPQSTAAATEPGKIFEAKYFAPGRNIRSTSAGSVAAASLSSV